MALQRAARRHRFDFWRSESVLRRYDDRARWSCWRDVGLTGYADAAGGHAALRPQARAGDRDDARARSHHDAAGRADRRHDARGRGPDRGAGQRVAQGRTVLMVEHNLKVVEGLCDTITVLTRGRVLAEGPYAEVSRNPEVDRRLSRHRSRHLRRGGARACLTRSPRRAPTRCCCIRDLEAWYGESHVLHGVSLDVGQGEVVTLLGRNGAGKTTHAARHHGPGRPPDRLHPLRGAGDDRACSPDAIGRAGIAYCPEERGIFASLDVTENLHAAAAWCAPGGLDLHDDLRAVPEPQGARAQPGHEALGRRAADAGDRPHPAHRRAAAAAGRADGGAGAGDRAADRRHDPARSSSAASPCCWWSRTSASPRPSPTATTSWSTGGSWTWSRITRWPAAMDRLHAYLGV